MPCSILLEISVIPNENLKKHVSSFLSPQCVSIRQRTCETDAADENSSFIFTVCVRFVPLYHLKLAYVVLHMVLKRKFYIWLSKEVLETHF